MYETGTCFEKKDIPKNNFTKEYYKGGQIKGEGNYIDDLKAGKWIYYYKTGEIRTKVNFENGKKDINEFLETPKSFIPFSRLN